MGLEKNDQHHNDFPKIYTIMVESESTPIGCVGSNTLDLRELSRKLDESLAKETKETLIEWLNIKDNEIRDAADEWVFETNGLKWSNNDNTTGDNHRSFMAGAKWAFNRFGEVAETKDKLKNKR